jgi:uncharacterized protein YijF (DUF1287 family)
MRARKSPLIATGMLLSTVAVYAMFSYHGPIIVGDSTEAEVDMEKVVKAARRLRGTFYDPFQGKHGNIGRRIGFIVCSDVPVIAYGNAGYSLQKMLREDFRIHPEHYDARNSNVPSNPFFHRRARNIFAYCRGNDRLLPPSAAPRLGDVAFYKRHRQGFVSHIALVSSVDDDGSYLLVEAAPLITREVAPKSIKDRGWIHLGFGRIVRAAAAS